MKIYGNNTIIAEVFLKDSTYDLDDSKLHTNQWNDSDEITNMSGSASFLKNMYAFLEKHVNVLAKTRTCFSTKRTTTTILYILKHDNRPNVIYPVAVFFTNRKEGAYLATWK